MRRGQAPGGYSAGQGIVVHQAGKPAARVDTIIGEFWTNALVTFKMAKAVALDCYQFSTGPRRERSNSPTESMNVPTDKRLKPRTGHRQRKRERLVPAESDVTLAKQELPIFEPIDTQKLLAEARRSSTGANLDDAVADAYNKHCRVQVAKLLRALGGDPKDKNFWPDVFVKLARIHHNLGRLVVRPARPTGNASSWTAEDEALLLCGVISLKQLGMSEREAVRDIADNKIFPYAERLPSERLRGQPTQQARRNALWQKFQRLKKEGWGGNALGGALGSRTLVETWLSLLENPPPDLPKRGNKLVRVNKGIRKSPAG